jgi:hypothetical protein
MDTHVKVLGALEIALGIMGLFGAAVLLVVFGVGATMVGASGEPNATVALPIIGLTGMALVTFLVLMSLPGVIIGIGLIRLRPWARIAAIVLSILSLTMVPFGTIVGIYGLWVLFNSDTERLFASPSAT